VSAKAKFTDKDRGWAELFRRATNGSFDLKVGVLADSGKGGATHKESDLTVAQIATIMEFGTEDKSVPARPAFRQTFEAERERMFQISRDLIKAFVEGKMTAERAANQMGRALSSAVKKTISSGSVRPDIEQSTKQAKGSDVPLIDSRQLLNAITWKVTMKGKSK
jgi:hypothetical protein